MLHLKIIGPDGKPIKASIDLAGDAIQFQHSSPPTIPGQRLVTRRRSPFGR